MANVAKYDKERVIRQAMLLFWKQGFHATSTRELQKVVNLRPGSFYAAFGSKEALFREVINQYYRDSRALLHEIVAEQNSVLLGLREFVKKVVLDRRASAPSDLCLLVKTITELTDQHAELLAESRLLLKQMEAEFCLLFEQAINQGELSNEAPPKLLARSLMAQIMGLRSYLRGCNQPEMVEDMVDDLFVRF
ncbi:TetR/AcrR family transcriptional regulator [uncultured Neptuniibacter sp.]|uniref:TetR/AcrR family transcriptional regulator n=1 Tax=uncultured Neptuniibacter sp. TaxID=502143 RepID=UPI002605740C|nr:TetR/AcrR family transcriptional regulator [uncultured Neptuniibacter sp.]